MTEQAALLSGLAEAVRGYLRVIDETASGSHDYFNVGAAQQMARRNLRAALMRVDEHVEHYESSGAGVNVDLMCHICGGSGVRAYEPAQRCVLCRGSGRRYPTLREWDALVAERGRLREALERCRKRPPPADRAVCPLCWDGACEEQPPTVCRASWCVCGCNEEGF